VPRSPIRLWRREDRKMAEDDDETGGSDGRETPDSAALYIASLADELAKIAHRNGLEVLGYILEMARIEADQVAKD
jgi:hypothetical protein